MRDETLRGTKSGYSVPFFIGFPDGMYAVHKNVCTEAEKSFGAFLFGKSGDSRFAYKEMEGDLLMKKIISLLLAVMMVLSICAVSPFAAERKDYNLRVLTFEDADYKGGKNFAGGNDWTSLVDEPQYGGKLLYGSSGMGTDNADEAYKWNDENNTFLSSMLSHSWNTYCYWGGGHAISNYASGDVKAHGGFNSQLTVFKKGVEGLARTGGGHNGSNNFAIH